MSREQPSQFEYLTPSKTALSADVIESAFPTILSPQERRCAGLVVQGYSNKAIATELSLSFSTVNNHLYNVMSKLAIRAREDLALVALSHGSFSPADLIPGYDLAWLLKLSSKEMTVLSYLPGEKMFHQDKEIALELGVSENNVGILLSHAYQKLGVSTRMQAGIVFLSASDLLESFEDAFATTRRHGFYASSSSGELTRREKDILSAIHEGNTTKSISLSLGISIDSCNRLLHGLYTKFDVSGKKELIGKARDVLSQNATELESLLVWVLPVLSLE